MEVLNYRDLPKFELETGFKKTSENYYPMEGSMLKITQKAWSYQISNLSSLLRLKQIADSCNEKYSVPILIMSCSVLFRLLNFLDTQIQVQEDSAKKILTATTYELDVRNFAGAVFNLSKKNCDDKDLLFMEQVLKFLAKITFSNKEGHTCHVFQYKAQKFKNARITISNPFLEFCELLELNMKGKTSVKLFPKALDKLNKLRKYQRASAYFLERLFVTAKHMLHKKKYPITLGLGEEEILKRRQRVEFLFKEEEDKSRQRLELLFKKSNKVSTAKKPHPITFSEIRNDAKQAFAKLNIDEKFINTCAEEIINKPSINGKGKSCGELYMEECGETNKQESPSFIVVSTSNSAKEAKEAS